MTYRSLDDLRDAMPCGHRPVDGADMIEHQRNEHNDCPDCGAEVDEPYCVRHEMSCPRLNAAARGSRE